MRLQAQNESISDYVAAFQKFTVNCGVSCSSCNQSVADLFFRAQFIRGIKDSTIREQLLQIKDLTFNLVVEKVLVLEPLKIDSQTISNSAQPSSNSIIPASNINRVSTYQSRSRNRDCTLAYPRNHSKSQ